MIQRKVSLTATYYRFLALTLIACTFFLSACDNNDCEDVVCAPCQNSRLLVQYQDSTGACPSGLSENARIVGLRSGNMTDTVYNYGLSANCMAAFILDSNVVFKVVSTNPAFEDVLSIGDFGFQPGVEVSTCCLCYPVDSLSATLNGNAIQTVFNTGQYDSNPFIRVLN